MYDEMLNLLRMEHLEGEYLLLAEAIGIEAFRKLVSLYGGSNHLYVPQAKNVLIPVRDDLIREEFTGDNLLALCRKWDLSESTVRNIVREKAKEIRRAPVDGQITFDEI